MNTTKLTALLAAGMLLAPTALLAEDDKPKRPGAGNLRDRAQGIAQQLDLSAEQRKQWTKLGQAQAKKMREVFQQRDLAREARQKKLAAIRQETNAKLAKILNEKQLAKYKELTQRRPQPRPGGNAGGGGARRNAAAYLRQLDLTQDQQAKVREIYAGQRDTFAKLRELPQAERAAKYREIAGKLEKQILAGLTDAQKKKLEQLRKEPPANAPRPQPRPRPNNNPFAQLELSPEQATALREIREEQQAAFAKIRELPQADRAGKYRELSQKFQKQFMEILTDEQRKKFQELRRQQPRPDRPRQSDRRPKKDA